MGRPKTRGGNGALELATILCLDVADLTINVTIYVNFPVYVSSFSTLETALIEVEGETIA
jgi:hypothetical protein